jgi:hypothetical protein
MIFIIYAPTLIFVAEIEIPASIDGTPAAVSNVPSP